VFFKENGPKDWRVSMRLEGRRRRECRGQTVRRRRHKNASGCSVDGQLADLKALFARDCGGNRQIGWWIVVGR
jgi:hypothetical protein